MSKHRCLSVRGGWLSSKIAVGQYRELIKWRSAQSLVPPPHGVKQLLVRRHGRKYGLRTLVETGTYHGLMVEMMLPCFDSIYSVELSEELFRENQLRFEQNRKVHLVQGDSAAALPVILRSLDRPAVFWLDGHYSEGETARGSHDTPVREELVAVAQSPVEGHVVLIDDARAFGVDPDYPSLAELQDLVAQEFPMHRFAVKDDVIRITPVG